MSEQQLKAQLEVLHAEYVRKSLLLINATKRLELSEELNQLQRELITAQTNLIAELKLQISSLSECVNMVQKILTKEITN